MDQAYEGREKQQQATALMMETVVSPLKSCRDPWEYDRELYKKRNEAESPFWRWKGCRPEGSLVSTK